MIVTERQTIQIKNQGGLYMITRLGQADTRTKVLEDKIKGLVEIPVVLKRNLQFSTTSLGGLFLSFYSNIHKKNVYKENSKMYFMIQINCEMKYNSYVGEIGTLECNTGNLRNFENMKYIRGFKKPTDVTKIIKRLNDYIDKHRHTMTINIEE